MIINDELNCEQFESVDYSHKQKILKTEVDMLSGLIAEMEARLEEVTTNLNKLTVVRSVLEAQIDPELELGLDSES